MIVNHAAHFRSPEIAPVRRAVHITGRHVGTRGFQTPIEHLHLRAGYGLIRGTVEQQEGRDPL